MIWSLIRAITEHLGGSQVVADVLVGRKSCEVARWFWARFQIKGFWDGKKNKIETSPHKCPKNDGTEWTQLKKTPPILFVMRGKYSLTCWFPASTFLPYLQKEAREHSTYMLDLWSMVKVFPSNYKTDVYPLYSFHVNLHIEKNQPDFHSHFNPCFCPTPT